MASRSGRVDGRGVRRPLPVSRVCEDRDGGEVGQQSFATRDAVHARAARKVTRMASTGRELLGEHYDDEHLTYEEIQGLGLRVITQHGEAVPNEELRGKIFRIVDKDNASGYVVSPTESTGTATILCY